MKTFTPITTISSVVTRHQIRIGAIVLRGVPVEDHPEIHHTSGGAITAHDLARIVEGQVGRLRGVAFHRSLRPSCAEFVGLDRESNRVRGWVELHAAVKDDAIVCWAEVTIDPGCP